MPRRGVYPGTFNPLTVAHLAIAEAACTQCALDTVVLAVSTVALGKESLARPLLRHRVEVLEAAAATRPWLAVEVTDRQLVADISEGFDVVIMGADKWAQLGDPAFYGDDAGARDDALARLPTVAVAPRPPHAVPAGAVALEVPSEVSEMSATAARSGAVHLMSEEASAFDRRTGAWTDPDRYRQMFAAELDGGGVIPQPGRGRRRAR